MQSRFVIIDLISEMGWYHSSSSYSSGVWRLPCPFQVRQPSSELFLLKKEKHQALELSSSNSSDVFGRKNTIVSFIEDINTWKNHVTWIVTTLECISKFIPAIIIWRQLIHSEMQHLSTGQTFVPFSIFPVFCSCLQTPPLFLHYSEELLVFKHVFF